MPAAGTLTSKALRAKAPPASDSWATSLAAPADFMSAVATKIKKEDQTNTELVALNTTEVIVTPTKSPVVAKYPTELDDPTIRRVPVEGFSFQASGALAPGEVDTHTDGAPTSGTFSGFSTSTDTKDQASVQSEPQNDDLIGLGIANVDVGKAPAVLEVQTSLTAPAQVVAFSPTGSIMDSPILDDVQSEVLTAKPGNILDIVGRKYIALDDLLALRDAIDKKINEAKASDTTQPTTPTQAAVAAPTKPSSTSTPSETVTVVPAGRANPFATREPLAANDVNVSSTPVVSETKKIVVAAEPVKPAATRRPAPFSSNTKISSKWGDDPSPVTTKKEVPVATTAPAKTARPGPPSSNTQIFSKWATQSELSRAPVTAAAPTRSGSPIFGDRKAFGYMSEEARKVQEYTAPAPKPKSKTKSYIQPGDGYKWLLREINAMKVDDDDEDFEHLRRTASG